jgi:hypothetical protein
MDIKIDCPELWLFNFRHASGQGSWLRIQMSGFDSRSHKIFWEVLGLERGPLTLVMIIEELFQGNNGSGQENRD